MFAFYIKDRLEINEIIRLTMLVRLLTEGGVLER